MNILRGALGFVVRLVNGVFTIVLALLLLRAAVEFIPSLGGFLPIRTIVRWADPYLIRAAQAVGAPWTPTVRGMGLAGLAFALVVLRGVLAQMLGPLLSPKPKPAAPAPAPAPVAAAAPPAAPPLDGSTAVIAGRPQPVQSMTGTAFLGSAAPKVPQRIGRYEILGELGHGAMGTVYKAQDPKIGRVVAIKTITGAGAGMDLEQYRARFLQEAKSAGRLNHPGIVGVYDVADDDAGRPCLVLEFVDGQTLDRVTDGKPLDLARTLDIVSQVARALAFAHGFGVIHRDVKPANIMLTAKGVAKLSDFGIAKVEGMTMTMTGQILGTPAFMSPEQCTGATIDHRSDIFSLGAVLYLLLTGTKPFPGDTFTAVSYKVAHVTPPPVREGNPELPEALEAILGKCLAKDPAARYASAADLADDLDALRNTRP